LAGSLLTGIVTHYAFADIAGKQPSYWPRLILLAS
jgi:hypothetical protein